MLDKISNVEELIRQQRHRFSIHRPDCVRWICLNSEAIQTNYDTKIYSTPYVENAVVDYGTIKGRSSLCG